MKQTLLLLSLVALVIVCSLVRAADNNDKIICAFKCWKQQRGGKRASAEVIKDCLNSCKRNATAAEEQSLHDESFADQSGSIIDQQKLWDQYRTVLVNALTKGKPEDRPFLQILTRPIEAVWDTQDPAQLTRLSDTVPYWGEYYFESPFKIGQQYCDFITNIRTSDQVVNQNAKIKADQLAAENTQLGIQLNAKKGECFQRFAALSEPKPDLTVFLKGCLDELVGPITKKMSDNSILYYYYTAQAYGPKFTSLFESRDLCTRGTEWSEKSAGALKKFRTDAQGNSGQYLSVYVESFTRANKPRSWSDVSSGIKRPSSLDNSFFQFATQVGNGYMVATEHFKMKIEFKSYGYISTIPDQWFRHSLLQTFKNGPFTFEQKNVFGQEGTMRLKPIGFYVAYKPTITAFVNRRDTQKFFANNVRSIGGFSRSTQDSIWIDTNSGIVDTDKITFVSNSNNPIIIAVDNELLPQ